MNIAEKSQHTPKILPELPTDGIKPLNHFKHSKIIIKNNKNKNKNRCAPRKIINYNLRSHTT